MQISRRFLFLACVATTVLLPNFVQAQDEDSETQRKAREALERAMQALPPESTPATPAPKVSAPEKKAEKKTAPAKAKKEPVFQDQKPEAPATTVAPVVAKPAEAAPAAAGDAQFQPLPETKSDAAAAAKASDALNQRMREIEAKPEASEPEMTMQQPAKTEKPAARSKDALTFTPMQGPETGLSAAKEQRLKTLLDDYRADKLTPEQYQEQRAKILAEP